MKILTQWLRAFLPTLALTPLDVTDRQLADDLTLRGIAVEGVHDLGVAPDGQHRGHLFEMDITTNRVDAMNHYGIAREAAAIYNLPLPPLVANLPFVNPAAAFPIHIDPAVQHLCGRFTARVLRGITVSGSTGEVARYFDLLGQKRISAPVDASNFVLLGLGHPTHAFDLDRIEGGIVVRFARAGERLRLLDGIERTLAADDLVIADQTRALSLAGVMGGLDSSITASTRNILVEAAWFDPATIRRSARRYGLHTDASHRFERGADFDAAPLANDLVSSLILKGGGRLEGDLIDISFPETAARTSRRAAVTLSTYDVQRQLGSTLDDAGGRSALTPELIAQLLSALGCTLRPAPVPTVSTVRSTLHARQDTQPDTVFAVTLPSWRLDLERPIDLVEEVARVFGYNRFRNTLPIPLPIAEQLLAPAEAAVRSRLLALGFSESISSTFTSRPASEHFAPTTPYPAELPRQPVRLENPLSEEVSDLRPSLVPGMLSMLAHNLNRDVTTVQLFEIGHCFQGVPESIGSGVAAVEQTLSLALGVTAAAYQATLLHAATDVPVFELKGAIESVVALFAPSPVHTAGTASASTGALALTFTTVDVPAWLEPGRSGVALLDGLPIARFGQLTTAEAATRKLRQPVFVAEVDLDQLLAHALSQPIAAELSRFQAVARDFSFVFAESTPWAQIASTVDSLGLPDLLSVAPVEIFRDLSGKTIAIGSYSLLLRTVFQSLSRTLTEEDLSESSRRILAALTALGGLHRG